MASTSRGVLRVDSAGLQLVSGGTERLVLKDVVRLAMTGNGRWVYLERRHGHHYAMWRMHPSGRGRERLYPLNYPGYGYVSAPHEGYTYYAQPTYDGKRMLSQLDGTEHPLVISHNSTHGPKSADPVLPFTSLGAITWN